MTPLKLVLVRVTSDASPYNGEFSALILLDLLAFDGWSFPPPGNSYLIVFSRYHTFLVFFPLLWSLSCAPLLFLLTSPFSKVEILQCSFCVYFLFSIYTQISHLFLDFKQHLRNMAGRAIGHALYNVIKLYFE